jgi:hypothetical protein
MFVFACPIIARSECWLSGQIRGKYPYLLPNSTSGICAVVSKLYVKVQGNMVHKDMRKIVFQSNTFLNIKNEHIATKYVIIIEIKFACEKKTY